MDIVLGVSMTPTTVRMVLVEGEKADGSIVDHDAFDITANDGSATSLSAAEQVVEAVLGTKESATAGGHHLKSIGVTWSHHAEASTLRDALAARGVDDVMLVSDGHAAAALAQAVGRAVGYATTALLFIDRDTATLSVVQTDDGSVVKVLSRSLHSDDAMAVLTEMAAAVDAQDSPPQGMFVVGSGVDVSSVKSHLENLVSLPVSAPDEPELALARGAALASATAPAFEATTVGLAYSQDPDGTTAGTVVCGRRRGRDSAGSGQRRAGRRLCGTDRYGADCCRGGPQAVPARRQRADVDLRGWRCGAGHFARREHPADGRSAAKPRAERDRAEHRSACARRRCRKHSSPSRRLHLRRPSNRRCPSPCRRPPRLSRRRARCSSSRPPPRRRQRPPHHRLRHRLHPRRRRPHRFPWHQRRCPIFRRRCTTRRCTTRTCRRRFTTRGPGRGRRRMHRRAATAARRSLRTNRRSHRGTRSGRDPAAARVIPVTIREVTTRDPGSGGYPGSGGPGGSSGGNHGGSGGCFLIFCASLVAALGDHHSLPAVGLALSVT